MPEKFQEKITSFDKDFNNLKSQFGGQSNSGTDFYRYKSSDERFREIEEKHRKKIKKIRPRPRTIELDDEEEIATLAPVKKKYYLFGSLLLLCVFSVFIYAILFLPNELHGEDYSKAVTLMNDGQYAAAIELFERNENFEQSREYLQKCRFELAQKLYEDEEYDEAYELYSILGEFESSIQKAIDCRYKIALQMLENGSLNDAADIFLTISDYKDVKSILSVEFFDYGTNLIKSRNYKKAYVYFDRAESLVSRDIYLAVCKTYLLLEEGGNEPDSNELAALYEILEESDIESAKAAAAEPLYHFIRLKGVWADETGAYILRFDERFELNLPMEKGIPKLKVKGRHILRCDNFDERKNSSELIWTECFEILKFDPSNAREPLSVEIKSSSGEVYTLYRTI